MQAVQSDWMTVKLYLRPCDIRRRYVRRGGKTAHWPGL
jgi:hypothetical protein